MESPAPAPAPASVPTAPQIRVANSIPEIWLRDWYLQQSDQHIRSEFMSVRWMGNHLKQALMHEERSDNYLLLIGFDETAPELARLQATKAFAIFPELRDL